MKILRTFLLVLVLAVSFSFCAFADGEVTSVSVDALTLIKGANPDTSSSDKVVSSGNESVYIPNGQSAGYNINVAAESEYVLEFVGKSSTLIGYYDYYTVEICLDGKMLRVINVPLGESTDDIFSVETRPFTLTAGEHTISVVPRSGGTGIHMNELVLDPMLAEQEDGTGAYKSIELPSVIEAEDFDYQTWHATDSTNDSRLYRKNTGIDIYPVDSDEYYVELKESESTEYTFTNQSPGIFAFSVFCFGGDGVNVYFDEYENPLYVPSNERIGNSREINLYIPGGSHTIRLEAAGDVIKVDNISLFKSEGEYITLDKLGDFIDDTEVEKEHTVYKNLYVANSGSDSADGDETTPFATISRAKEEVSKLAPSMTGDIVVNISPGYYELSETEVFDISQSGLGGYDVIFRGTDRDNPPVISGGTRITGWESCGDYMWRAPVPEGITDIRNLYINSYPATRAASKYLYKVTSMYDEDSTDSLYDGFVADNFCFPDNLTNHSDIELVFPIEWTSQYVKVESVEYTSENVIIHANTASLNNHTNDEIKPKAGKSFSIENAFELLDEPGEFYYNKSDGFVYYYPYTEEDMTTAEVFVGRLEKILSVEGTSRTEKVHNLIFDNLDIRYTAWSYPDENGFCSLQADTYYKGLSGNYTSHQIPGAVEISKAENIGFINNRLTCHGLTALKIPSLANDIKIEGNIIADCSGSGIAIGNTSKVNDDNPLVGDIDVINNVITRVAAEFRGSVGILVYYTHHINIQHNKIVDLPYTGISLGWGWIHEQPEGYGYFTVRHNVIDTVMTTTRDGSHIYCLGPMRYSDISYNYLTNANPMHKIGGIYFDSGCKWAHAHHNVITDSPAWFHMSGYNWIFGHRVDSNYSDITTVSTYGDPGSLYFEYPTELGDDEASWTAEAQSIKSQAGLESEYAGLNELSGFPSWRKSRTQTAKKYLYAAKSQYDEGVFVSQEDFMAEDTKYDFGQNEEAFKVSAEGVTILNPRIFNYTNASTWYWYDAEYKYDVPNPDAYPWFTLSTDNSEGIYVGYDLDVEEAGAYRVTAMAGAVYKESGIEILRPGTKDNSSYTESVIGADILMSSGKIAKTGSKSKAVSNDLGIINLKEGSNRIYFRNKKSLSEACYVGLIKLERVGDYAVEEPVKVSVRDYSSKSLIGVSITHNSNTSEYREISPYASLGKNKYMTFSVNAEQDGIYMFTIYQGGSGASYKITIGNETFSGITPLYNDGGAKKASPVVAAAVSLTKGNHTVKITNTASSSASLSFFTYQRIADNGISDSDYYMPYGLVDKLKSGDNDSMYTSFLKRYGDIVLEAEDTETPTYTEEYTEGALQAVVLDSSTDGTATGVRISNGEKADYILENEKPGYYRMYAYVGSDYGNKLLSVSINNKKTDVSFDGPLYYSRQYICLGDVYLTRGENEISLALVNGDSLDIDYIGFKTAEIRFYKVDGDNRTEAGAVAEGTMSAEAIINGFSDNEEQVLCAFVIYKGTDIAYIDNVRIKPYDGITLTSTIENIKLEEGYEYTAKYFIWDNNLIGICEVCR